MLVANVSVHHQRTQTFCLTLTLANTHFFIALLVCVIEWCCDCVFSYSLCDCFFCVLFVRLWVFVGVIWSVGPVEQRSVSGTWWTEESSGFGIKPHDLAAPSPWSKCHLLAENLFRPPPPSTSVWATYYHQHRTYNVDRAQMISSPPQLLSNWSWCSWEQFCGELYFHRPDALVRQTELIILHLNLHPVCVVIQDRCM